MTPVQAALSRMLHTLRMGPHPMQDVLWDAYAALFSAGDETFGPALDALDALFLPEGSFGTWLETNPTRQQVIGVVQRAIARESRRLRSEASTTFQQRKAGGETQ